MKRSKKGFTLAELLVVIAIIAILVAIAIPTFSAAKQRAVNAVAEADARSAYAEFVVDKLNNDVDQADAKTYTYSSSYGKVTCACTDNGDGTVTVVVTMPGTPQPEEKYATITFGKVNS